jgi:large subunit ribosomal protein L31
MKISHHPVSIETDITCTCGATLHTRSTVPNMRVAVCSNCHPFFTGRQKMVDTVGRVEAFRKKYGKPLARDQVSLERYTT